MEYDPDFERDFMRRTLAIVQGYDGTFDATILINCLLGLLVMPKETLFNKIPMEPYENLAKWGVSPTSVKKFGKCEYGHEHPPTLRQLVKRMRNAVAHFKIVPVHNHGEVDAYEFKDRNGFHAVISVSELKSFVTKLAAHLEQHA